MIDQEKDVRARAHFLDPACLRPYLEAFVASLVAAGYATHSISNYRDSVAHFGTWIERNGIVIGDIEPAVITAFADHRCDCPGGRRSKRLSRRYVARVRRFVRCLNRQGIVDAPREEVRVVYPATVAAFRDALLRHRGLSTRTVDRYVRLVIQLLPMLGDDPALYDAATVRQAIEAEAHRYSRATVQGFTTALRAYLRFLASQGHCRPGLESAVPTVPQWRLSALPRYLVADEIERVITSCDRHTACGLRDRAVLLLLARLGLRAGDIVKMSVEDIDWSEGTLQVCGKGRRAVRLPLPQEPGDALLAYMEQARPIVPVSRIFLCAQAPYRAFPSSVVVSDIVRSALARAGITNPPSRGANLLRHSAATTMLRAGLPLDAVSTLLRHRSLDTSAHYAKVDVAMLRPIAQPWPEGVSC